MKKIALVVASLLFAAPAFAANVNIDGLPAATSVTGTDLYECEQGGTNNKCTPAQLSVYLNGLITGDCTITANVITCTNTGAAGGDLAGTFPSPTVKGMHGLALSVPAAAGGTITSNATWAHTGAFTASGVVTGASFTGAGTGLTGLAASLTAGHVTTNANLTGDVTSVGNATTLATSGVTAGAYTSANITVDSKGRVTLAANGTGGGGGGSGTVTSISAGCGTSTGGSPITTSGAVVAATSLRVASGTTDPITSADACNVVYYSNAAAVAVTLPAATTSGFGNGTTFTLCDINAVGTTTVTPATSTIGGQPSLPITGGTAISPNCVSFQSDGTNYNVVNTVYGVGVPALLHNAASAAGGVASTIASGTAALGTAAIASGACATAVTATATGVATTDTVTASFNGDPTAVTGYIPTTAGMLTIITYPTANTFNAKVCNQTSASITPGAITLNWRVVR